MVARGETILKWALYCAAAALCFFVQGFLLQRVTLWGVIPFLFPVLAAVPATYEGPVFGTAFALGLGVVCDLLLAAPLPCFYTLALPASALCAGLIAKAWLPAGPLCALAAGAAAFVLTDGFHCLLLVLPHRAAWSAAALVAGSETLVTLLFLPVIYPLFWWVHRRSHLYD